MKHSITYLFLLLAASACGTGVDRDPKPILDPELNPDSDKGQPPNPCPAPAGPPHAYATAADLDALILGRWRQCAGPKPPTLDNSLGLEFVANGTYFVLVDDGKGGLMRGTGFSGQGQWNSDQVEEGVVFLVLHETPSSQFGDTPLFEDGPRRFAIDPSHQGDESIYELIGP